MSDTLGKFIQRRLDALGWKQADLARCTGLSPAYISSLTTDTAPGSQRGSYIPEPDKLETIARCLQCSRAELLVAMGYLPAGEAGDPALQRIREVYRRLPAAIKDFLSTVVQSLDQRYGGGKEVARHPKVLSPNDPRPDTERPISAGKLSPQKDASNSNKKRGGNGG